MSKLSVNIHRGIIALALSFSFMFFIYAPLEVFLGNTNEFWFDITHLLPVIVVCFLISSVIIILLLELLYKFLYPRSKNAKRAFYIVYTIMLMIFVGLYIQGNYIPRDYGVLDGREIDWSAYPTYAIASIILWIIIVIVGIFLWIKLRKQMFKIGQGVSALVFVMLIVALISLGLNAQNIVKKDNLVVSDKGQWTLSENKNIYVLVLDTFDAEYFRVLMEEEGDEYFELLEDFTFYSNSIGGYPTTKASIPLMLTGEWYENDIPYNEYVINAYESGAKLYEELKENDYSIGVYTSNIYLNQESQDYQNVFLGKYKIKNLNDFAKTIFKLITFEYLPHQLKKNFVIDTNEFEAQKMLTNGTAYSMSDEKWYKTICEEGFELTSESNCFKFIHLFGMHPPYIFGENVVADGNEYSCLDAAKGNMNEIKALIENLKINEVYDNTAIMILADHGDGELTEMRCNPLLLVKGFDEHHEFTISESPVSWADIYPTILTWASGEEQENAIWNISNGERERRYLYYTWDDSTYSAYMPTMIEYVVLGNIADNTATFSETGKQFTPSGVSGASVEGLLLPDMAKQDSLYRIEVYPDSASEDFQSMYVSGLGKSKKRANGQKYAWSKGYYTHLKLNPEGEQKVPYTFTVNFDEIYSVDNLNIEMMDIYAIVNGEVTPIDKFSENSITFTVSKKALSADVIDVMIFYPNYSTEDDRTLAITSIVLEQKVPININRNSVIDFSKNGNFQDMVATGWNGQEESGVWSTDTGTINFLSDNDSDLVMQIQYGALVSDIPTIIKVNGNEVCTLSQENAGQIIIPKEYLNPSLQELEFLTEGAMTPAEAGINGDTRTLGIYVQSITITDSAE